MAKDFNGFVDFLESDECEKELDELIDGLCEELEGKSEAVVTASLVNMMTNFKLRKYHELISS